MKHADEGRAVAAFDHVGLADELVDAARALRQQRPKPFSGHADGS